MVNTITLKELRPELPAIIKKIDSRLDRYVVTRRGKPVAVMISPDDYEGLLETVENSRLRRAGLFLWKNYGLG